MGGTKLDLAPSRGLGILEGVIKGITGQIKAKKEEALAQQKMQSDMFMRMFGPMATLEGTRLKVEQSQTQFESAQAQKLEELGLTLKGEKAERRLKWDIFKEEIGVKLKKLDIDLTTAREGLASAENIAEYKANAEQIAIGLRAQADQILATVKAELDAAEAGRQRTFLTGERKEGETFTATETQKRLDAEAEENRKDRAADIMLRGSQEDKAALESYKVLEDQLFKLQEYMISNPNNESLINQAKVIIGSMDALYPSVPRGTTAPPPTFEEVKERKWHGFGFNIRERLTPGAKTPTVKPSGTADTTKISTALTALQQLNRTSLTDQDKQDLKDRGYDDATIREIDNQLRATAR